MLLNGASSSGKTAIARCLQGLYEEPWLRMGVDALRTMVPPDRSMEAPGELVVMPGVRRAVRAMADAGVDVVVDDIILERAWLVDWAAALDGVSAWIVGVRCPAAVVRERMRLRGDGVAGDGVAHVPAVHAHSDYDVEVDTSLATPDHCARRIADHVASHPPRVLHRLLKVK